MTDSSVPQGYLPPADAYQPLPVTDGGQDPNDPLVNPPHSGINGWFERIKAMFKRSWKMMLAIFAITHVLPFIGFAIIGVLIGLLFVAAVLTDAFGQQLKAPNPDVLAIGIPVLILIVLVAVVLFVLLQSAGYAAATYAVTKQAAGYQVGLGEALGYGFRRALGLASWQIAVGFLVLLGFVACILPGFYVYAATALFGPIYLFERSRPIGRTFAIFNANLGRVLGRLALLLVATLVAGIASSSIDQIGANLTGNTDDLAVLIGRSAISSVIGIVIEIPLIMLTFAGILLTYTEQRGYEHVTSARSLAAEL